MRGCVVWFLLVSGALWWGVAAPVCAQTPLPLRPVTLLKLFEKPGAFPELNAPGVGPLAECQQLSEEELVVGIRQGNRSRCYPLRLLGEHRVLNDRMDDPVVITWDVDSSSARAYLARVEGRELSFRFQGWVQGTLLLRDNQTGSVWSHLTGYALGGSARGQQLSEIPVQVTTLGRWRRRHPTSELPTLDYATHYRGSYPRISLQLADGAQRSLPPLDARLPMQTLVLGVRQGGVAKAYPLERLQGVRSDRLAGRDIVLVRDETLASAVFEPQIDGQRLELSLLTLEGTPLLAADDGSLFDLSGRAVSGPLVGRQLPPVAAVEVKWYGWAGFHPQTLVDGEPDQSGGECPPLLFPGPRRTVSDPNSPPNTNPPATPRQARKDRRDARRKGAR